MSESATPAEAKCRVEGCGNKIDLKKHQLCSKHYQAFWKYGDPLGSPNKRERVPCTAPDCGRMGSGTTGLCHKHYLRMQRTGHLDLRPRKQTPCSVDGCGDTAQAKGLCQRHYDRQRGAHRRATGICSRPGCGVVVKARGLCRKHYSELQRRGALHTAPRQSSTREVPERNCRGCGADISGLSRGRRYCSDACKAQCVGPECNRKAMGRGLCSSHLKQSNAGLELRPLTGRVVREPNQPCDWCETPVGADNTGAFCSAVCRSLARRHRADAKAGNCAQCGKHIDYLAPASGTSGRLTPVSKRLCDECRHRSASLYMSADALRKRDGDNCHLCGLLVPVGARKPHPLSAEVDHILPISLGGTHDPENLALAHKNCNNVKGNQPATWRRDPAEVAPMLAEWNRSGYVEPAKTCSVDGCERRPESYGMCQRHRRRVMKHGSTDLPKRPTECVVDGCGQPVRSQGRCRSHYRVYLAAGKVCGVEGCSKQVHTRQLCRRHYQLWLDSRP